MPSVPADHSPESERMPTPPAKLATRAGRFEIAVAVLAVACIGLHLGLRFGLNFGLRLGLCDRVDHRKAGVLRRGGP